MALEKSRLRSIHFLCVVCNTNNRSKVREVLRPYEALVNLSTHGTGTANTRILSYLGLGESEKSVMLNIMPAEAAKQALDALHTKIQMDKPGHGIAFTARIYQGCYHRVVGFDHAANGGDLMQANDINQYSLVMLVLNRGYVEDVMDIARAAGVMGGTVLNVRSFGAVGMEKFFGMELSEDKELLMTVATRDAACNMMGKVAETLGPETDAGAISFAMPVEDVRGLPTKLIK